jgi:hypothetical protein
MTRNSSVAVRTPSMAQSVFEQRIVNGLPPSRTIWHARLLRVASTNSAVITEMRNAIEPIRSRAVATLFFDSPQRRWMGRHGRRRDQRSHRALVCAPPGRQRCHGPITPQASVAILRHNGVGVGKMDFLGPISLVDA